MVDPRDQMTGYLRSQLIGPLEGSEEFLTEDPAKRYLTSVLFGQESESVDAFAEDIVDDEVLPYLSLAVA